MSTSMIPIIARGSAGLYSVAMIAMKFCWKIPDIGLGPQFRRSNVRKAFALQGSVRFLERIPSGRCK